MKQHGSILVTLAIYAVIVAAIVALAWGIYRHIERTGYDRGMAKCAKDAKDQRDKELTQGDKASKGLETGNAKAKVIYRTITQQVDKYIDRPIYRNQCFDADGLRDANAALGGPRADTSKYFIGVSKPDASGGRGRSDGAKKDD